MTSYLITTTAQYKIQAPNLDAAQQALKLVLDPDASMDVFVEETIREQLGVSKVELVEGSVETKQHGRTS